MTSTAEVIDRLLADLVEVPGGTTAVGSTLPSLDAELTEPDLASLPRAWFLKEVPRHEVSLPTFRISRVPVTVAQVEALASQVGVRPVLTGGSDHPATLGVDASFAFCDALSGLTGHRIGLPTEAQWVRAARGDDERRYPWGDTWIEGRGNIAGASHGETVPVGSYPSGLSPYGVLDLVGNADELTCTRYAPFLGAPAEVPMVETWALSPYVTKGGGFTHGRDLARIDRRHGIYVAGEPLAVRLVVAG